MAYVPPGVAAASGIVVNKTVYDFLALLKERVGDAAPLYVTSGVRTATAQARALQTKRNLDPSGGGIRALYRRNATLINEILAAPNTVAAMARVIQAQISRGSFLSRHMRGDAVDLRSRNLNSTQLAAIVNHAKSLGANVVVERSPAHIHIGGLGSALQRAQQVVTETVRKGTKAGKRAGRAALREYRRRQKVYTGGAVVLALGIVVILAVLTRKNRRTLPPPQN